MKRQALGIILVLIVILIASLGWSQAKDPCVGDANPQRGLERGNGLCDIVDIMTTSAQPGCWIYVPLVARCWRQPWPDLPIPWVWLEGEDFASTNFPRGSHSTRGEFCTACSGQEYLLFLPGRKGRPFDPPG